ncbi:hypothetical protein GCM10028808_62460 [Spirosoma migulaei]
MTKHPAQIVAFPFPKREASECLDDREAVFQLKLRAAKMLNETAAGTYIMCEENISGIHRINRLCREVGLTPLDF